MNDFNKITDLMEKVSKLKAEKERLKDKNIGELMANVTLAYRHVEDASMRLGKVKQPMTKML